MPAKRNRGAVCTLPPLWPAGSAHASALYVSVASAPAPLHRPSPPPRAPAAVASACPACTAWPACPPRDPTMIYQILGVLHVILFIFHFHSRCFILSVSC